MKYSSKLRHLLRSSSSILRPRRVLVPDLKKKALNSWSAVQDTFYSAKDTFERHKVVFTVGTSIASLGTALIGYSLRHYHEERVSRRLDSIEQAMKQTQNMEREELKKIVSAGSVSIPSCFATAGTALVIGYGLGWRGGRWFANRKFRREQMKLLAQPKDSTKPRKWRFQVVRRPWLARHKRADSDAKTSDNVQKESSTSTVSV